MKNVYVISLTLILGTTLFGCSTKSDNTENVNESVPNKTEEVLENNNNESNSNDGIEEQDPTLVLETISTQTEIRKVEGMDEEFKVIQYQIQPYDISFRLDESFNVPKVEGNQIVYLTQNDGYKIMLEMIEHTNLEKVIPNLQGNFAMEEYEVKSELESTPLEENNLNGKMQFYGFPMKGFYAYEIGEHVLVITYHYPSEAGDGMEPLLESLRTSINVP